MAANYTANVNAGRGAGRVLTLHRQMAVSFSSRSAGAEAGMESHCDRLADAAQQSATEYDALAAFHDAVAGKAASK